MSPLRIHWLGLHLQLARPDRWPWVAAALLALVFLLVSIWLRRRTLYALAPAERLHERLAPRMSLFRQGLRAGASGLGLLLLAIALLKPQAGEREVEVKHKGIDLVVAIDASRSMLARDVMPSRLERAKLELSLLIDRLRGDRIGIVVFAGDAFVQCPLTTDYGAAKLFLRAIDPEAMPSQGTAIARALRRAKDMLAAADHGATTRVVLLLSDGEDHSGHLPEAIRELQEAEVRVYALGIGSPSGTPIPTVDPDGRVTGYWKDGSGATVISRLDDRQLRRIASETGGKYVQARGGDLGMGEIFAELAQLEQSEREGRMALQWDEVYAWFAWPGFFFLWLGAAIPERRRR